MEVSHVEEAVELLEKANAELEPELLTADSARKLLQAYALVVRLGDYGVAALSRKVHDPGEVARVTGSSLGKARAVTATGEAMRASVSSTPPCRGRGLLGPSRQDRLRGGVHPGRGRGARGGRQKGVLSCA